MTQESLVNYIRTQVANGRRLDYITTKLFQQGFSRQQIHEAYITLGYFKSNQASIPSVTFRNTKKNFLPIVIAILAVLVLLVLGISAFNKNKNKSLLPHSSFVVSPTSQAVLPTQSLSACSLPTRWTSRVGTSFDAKTYLTLVSQNTCEYTDSILGYTIQYPANWYILFNPEHQAQPYNVVSFDSQQLSASTSSPLAVSIAITPSKTTYSDIVSYMQSIQKGPGPSYQQTIERWVYQPISIAGQKAVQMHYTLGNNVGIDTKFIFNGTLYDISFNGTNATVINANKQYYTNLLNSFRLQ